MKRVIVLLMVTVLVLSAFAVGCSKSGTRDTTSTAPGAGGSQPAGGAQPAKKVKVAMITDVGGLGDKGFNDAAYAGLQRAEKELGVQINVVESKEVGDYPTNLRTLAQSGYDLIFAVGAMMTDAVKAIAPEYPNTKFAIIDGTVDNLPNVASALYREQEAAFLLGAFAAQMTKTNTVGFVSGMRIPVMERFEAGFRAGVQTINPKVKALVAYTGSFNDVGKGKETANTLFQGGADIVSTAAGACNLGVFQAAKEKGDRYWVLGAGTGQFNLAPDKILASQVKRIDNTGFDIIRDFTQGKFKSGISVYGLKEGGVDLAVSPTLKDKIPAAVLTKVNSLRQAVISGQIVPPATVKDLANFQPPKLQ